MTEIPLVLSIKSGVFGQNGLNILNGVDFSLAQAEMCYLIGKSGSGKSTFLKTIYGAQPLISGQAEVVGFNLNDLSRKQIPELRRSLGMVFQDFHLFDRWSVAQNLDYVLRATDWKEPAKRQNRIEEVLNEIGIIDKKDI